MKNYFGMEYGVLKIKNYSDNLWLPDYSEIVSVKDGYILYVYKGEKVKQSIVNRFKADPHEIYLNCLEREFEYLYGPNPTDEEIMHFWY
jgi:hypothetical protein